MGILPWMNQLGPEFLKVGEEEVPIQDGNERRL